MLLKKIFFEVKISKKSAGSPCSDLRGWLIISTPASILCSLPGPPRAPRDQTLLPSSAHTPSPLVATAPSACEGRRVVAGAGNHRTGKSWPAGGVWVLLWSVGTPPTDDTHSLPHANDTCLPHSFPPPHVCKLLPGGAGCSSWGTQEPQAGSYFLPVLGPRPPLLGPVTALGCGAQRAQAGALSRASLLGLTCRALLILREMD